MSGRAVNSLCALDFIDEGNKPLEGLVPVGKPSLAKGAHERAVLLEIATFKHIDYVYFRRFAPVNGNTARSSQVAAYVIDNTGIKLDKDELARLHHKLWLHGMAPLVYVAWPTSIDILSCARKPDFWKDAEREPRDTYAPAESISAAADISDELAKRRRCSAYRLADGTFWDEPANQKLAREDAAAHRSLIQAIVEADKELDGERKPLRRRLLVLIILVKYLEDRGVFPKRLFGRFHPGARSFLDVLGSGTVDEVSRLLARLEQRFNGDVFSWGDDEKHLTENDIKRAARLIEGKTLGGQRHFWELFNFKHIPVEVISRLYQRFVTGHGAVYTPPFLAALLLDQVMPFGEINGDEKICDPACGSGVFLVGAFKRLITDWRSKHKWEQPSVDKLKRILSHSIHGVEMESGAVDLTAFSLALALCDALEPPVIWNELKFGKLRGRNLREGDFFDPATTRNSSVHRWPEHIDIIIGNPPFESKLTEAAKALDEQRLKKQPNLPDEQAAYLFLERSLNVLSSGGSLCMVQPPGLLYNSKTTAFRRHLMGLARLDTVLDFVSIRGMFDEKDSKSVAWYATKDDFFEKPVKHITFRRTYSVSEQMAFEVDHYDWHEITHNLAKNDPFVWRINLLGGGRLLDISERLRQLPTLATFVARRGWDYGEGFIAGKRANKAPFLKGLPLLPTRAFRANGIDESRLTTVAEDHFDSPRNPDRFTAPLLLVKEHASLPVAFWDKGPLAYRHKIVGIHSPAAERNDLLAVHEGLQSRKSIFQFCGSLHGTQALVGKATSILKQDIDQLPMPDDPSALDLCFWEEILKEDSLEYMGDYVRLGQASGLLKQKTARDDVREYSSLYRRMLGSLYRNLRIGDSVRLNGLIAQPFYFGEPPDVPWLGENCENALHRLIYEKTSEALRTVRVVRYYDGNVILIVKPDRLRYWIRSTAIRDADDTLVDLRQQGF